MRQYNVQQNTKYHSCDWLLLFLIISLYTTKGGPAQRYINIFNCTKIKKKMATGKKRQLWLKEYADNNLIIKFDMWLTVHRNSVWIRKTK